MTRQQLQIIAAVITTALETEPAPFPESYAYIAGGCDLHLWHDIKTELLLREVITIEAGPTIKLTDKGRKLARTFNAVIQKANAQ